MFGVEIDRMLADPKSRALTQALAGQWLQGRSLADAQPNPDRFPEMNDALKASMRGETERFVAEFLRDDSLTLGDLIDADCTFVNASLAARRSTRWPAVCVGSPSSVTRSRAGSRPGSWGRATTAPRG